MNKEEVDRIMKYLIDRNEKIVNGDWYYNYDLIHAKVGDINVN